jgi:phosphatidylinositol alpha-mannosyltransferase
MKIGLVCPYNLFKGGGVQECVLSLQDELQRRGHIVRIITPQPRKHDGVVKDHIILVGGSTDFRSPFHTTAQVSASVDVDAMNTVLEEENFDVLHFHEPWVPLLSRQILGRSKTVNIATFHAKLPETVMSKTIERVITPYTRSVLRYIDHFTAVSPAAAEYVRGLDDKLDINIIPNGIDLRKYRDSKAAPAANKKHKTILFVGRLEKRKGVRFLLEAFKELKKTDPFARLVIAGDGPERERLETWVLENKVTFVTFKGYVSDKEKFKLFSAADLFASPAIYGESFGIVLLEAMAMNRVIVAGDNPGYSSVLKGRGEISLVNPRDTIDFARRMHLLLNDEAIRALWRQWAKDYVKQYDYSKVVDMYEEIYTDASKAHKKRAAKQKSGTE